MFRRSEAWWRKRLSIPDLLCVVWNDSAYALYLLKMDSSTGSFFGEVEVIEALSESVEGHQHLWNYLLSLDLVRTVSASWLPVNHPLVLMLEDVRKLNARIRDGLWLRIIDMQGAMSSRTFGEGSVVIQVFDNHLSHNEGTWKIDAAGVCQVQKSPDLVVDIADLASVYLGGFTFSDLLRSGRIQEAVPGGVRKADRVFSAEHKPWCLEAF